MKQNTHIFSKFDLRGQTVDLVKYLEAHYSGQPNRVNALSPGGVYNGQSNEFIQCYSSLSIIDRLADEGELNSALLFLCSPASNCMTGANLVDEGGWTAWWFFYEKNEIKN